MPIVVSVDDCPACGGGGLEHDLPAPINVGDRLLFNCSKCWTPLHGDVTIHVAVQPTNKPSEIETMLRAVEGKR